MKNYVVLLASLQGLLFFLIASNFFESISGSFTAHD